jgi:hypothetical protein
MAASASASRSARRRWATVVALSAGLHALVLSGLAFNVATGPRTLSLSTIDVSLAPVAPLVVPQRTPSAPKPRPVQGRVVPMDASPLYAASAEAPTGEARDAVDLFGPVFDDGMWPRPVVVARAPCEGDADLRRAADCRKELLLIGLASDAAAGSNAGP